MNICEEKLTMQEGRIKEVPEFEDEKGCLHYVSGRIGENAFPARKYSGRLTKEAHDPRLAFCIWY